MRISIGDELGDCGRLEKQGAVIQSQGRDITERVDGSEIPAALHRLADFVDPDGGERQTALE